MISEKLYLYQDREDVTLTTYVLEDSPEMLKGKKRGAVLVCPGGAYLFCSDREGEPIAMAFANMGYHVFVLRYSVYFEGKAVDFEKWQQDAAQKKPIPVNPNSVYPNPLRDIGKAMLTIHDHAEQWHVDTEKIAICGFSAGGHNCAMYSVYWNQPVITEFFNRNAACFKPAASILAYPLTDYISMKDATFDDPQAKGLFHLVNIAYLGSDQPDDDLLHEVSPARLVHKQTPPTFIWSTAADGLVPIRQSTLMADALAQHNIPFEVHIFEKGEHGLSTATQSSAGTNELIDSDAAKWLPLCDAWLHKRFAFEF